jgi:steroid delta-isomerase-like uncharacterized protein
MANQANEAIARKGFEAFNTGDLSLVDEITAEGAVGHDPATPDAAAGPEGSKALIQMYRGAFSDLEFTIDEMISDGDFVVSRWSSRGTNDGELGGMPPTGRSITSSGITIDKIVDGKIVESWTQWDNLGLMQQLGVGAPAGAATN